MAEENDISIPEQRKGIALWIFLTNARHALKLDELGLEIAEIALPAALALTADPVASLIDTAFIGQIGPIELAAVGVSIALFNQVSRIAIFPLVSITTSFVAEEDCAARAGHLLRDGELLESSSANNEANELIPPFGENGMKVESSGFINENPKPWKRHIPSASSALIIGAVLGLIQAIFLVSLAKPLLKYMGIKPVGCFSWKLIK